MRNVWRIAAIGLISLCVQTPAQQQQTESLQHALQTRESEMRQLQLQYHVSLAWRKEAQGMNSQTGDSADATLVVDHFAQGTVMHFRGKRGTKAPKEEYYANVMLRESPVAYLWTDNNSTVVATHFGFHPETSLVPLILLSGVNPLRFAQPDTVQVRRTPRQLHVEFGLTADAALGGWSEGRLSVEFDPVRGMSPVKVSSVDRSGKTITYGEVKRLVKQNSVWLPQSVTFSHTRMGLQVTYHLQRASRSAGRAPNWLHEGVLVNDWRLGFENPIAYKFTEWTLPSVSELQQRQPETQQQGARGSTQTEARFPFLLPFFSSSSASSGTGG